MKNELMIDNYILGNYTDYGDIDDIEKQEICKVLALDSVGVVEYPIWVEGESGSIEHYDSFEGIVLNEEIILKLGFEKKSYLTKGIVIECFYYQLGNFIVYILPASFEVELINKSGDQFNLFKNWQYVHELQNLYSLFENKKLIMK